MTDASGKVTLSASYTPWGDLLSIEGEGGFTSGYFGGIMDTATGLLYVCNGQYYDPETGRFLTRNARPNQGNPYVPWQGNPSGSLISPLALLVLVYGRKRKRSKWDTLVILLVFGATMGMSLSACGEGGSITVTKEMGNFEVTATIMPPSASEQYGTATITVTTPSSPGQGTPIPSWTCTFALTTTATPTPTGTPTPSCPLCNTNPYAKMFLDAVLKHQNDLRPGFSVALLLAMGAHESGAMDIYQWSNSMPHGGVLQLRKESNHYHPDLYTDTPEGYEQNVVDAIALINEKYDFASATMDDPGALHFLYTSDGGYPNNPNEVNAARAVLYYNSGGPDWWNPENDYSYVNMPGNKRYVGSVAEKLENYVPTNFNYSDPTLVNILRSVQVVVNHYVPDKP